MKTNPAREALQRAVNRAIAEGSPVYVNQPYSDTAEDRLRIGNTPTCEDCDRPVDHCTCDEGEAEADNEGGN